MSSSDDCTYATCSVQEDGQIEYIPTLAGNAIYAGIFGLLLLAQTIIGVRSKTWGFLVGMACGIILEIIGYIGRVLLNDNVFEQNYFIIYLVGLTIGPAFLAASIYLCLGRIITIYSVELSLLKPRTITCIFVCCDFVSILLQAVGGAITATADDADGNQLGIDIMIAGLAFQVVALTFFSALCGHFAWKVVRNPLKINGSTFTLRRSFRFRGLLIAIGLAVLTILIRSAFRLAELKDGFDGELANDEVLFMILEGPMIMIAVGVLTVFHPGLVLGRDMWKATAFSFRSSRAKTDVERYKTFQDQDVEIQEFATVQVALGSPTLSAEGEEQGHGHHHARK